MMQNHSGSYSILTDTPSVEDEAEESESESCAAPIVKKTTTFKIDYILKYNFGTEDCASIVFMDML